ncbi:hypothetical protein ACH4D5_26310 [Streptomyces sp. NPDC018029]|uniref:hypothetical protein n=1 Tax=Streptomyces sp. NPDC018029 TaxID=3365032 RepID=UPI00379B5017
MGENPAADVAYAVGAPGQFGSHLDDAAGESLRVGGMLEQFDVGRRGRYTAGVVQQLVLLGGDKFGLEAVERADHLEGVVPR